MSTKVNQSYVIYKIDIYTKMALHIIQEDSGRFYIHHFDVIFTMTDFMYGPLRFTRSDLVAMTIQRGRDFGLRSYTEVRKTLDLPPVQTFEEINPELRSTNPQVKAADWSNMNCMKMLNINSVSSSLSCFLFQQLFHEVAELYNGDISELELFPGGLLESLDGPGPVFSAIILDQFERIRNGDRFWFENKQNG